jgi:hypothetical protein
LVVETWFLEAHFRVFENAPCFEIYFLGGFFGKAKATAKAKAIILSLRPSGFAPAFGRAEHALARYLDLSYEYAGTL